MFPGGYEQFNALGQASAILCEGMPTPSRSEAEGNHTGLVLAVNPSAWSDEPCSSCCTLSLIRLYLDKLGSKCNQAASRLFVKELTLL